MQRSSPHRFSAVLQGWSVPCVSTAVLIKAEPLPGQSPRFCTVPSLCFSSLRLCCA